MLLIDCYLSDILDNCVALGITALNSILFISFPDHSINKGLKGVDESALLNAVA
jgi:hypothetical protein